MGRSTVALALVAAVSALTVEAAGQEARDVNVRMGPRDQRPSMRWILTVTGGGLTRPQSNLVAEYEDGNVPLPGATPWRCRWQAVSAFRDRTMLAVVDERGQDTGLFKKVEEHRVFRSLRCSTDGFKTHSSHTGMYFFQNGKLGSEPSQAQMHLYATLPDDSVSDISVELRACPLSGPQPLFCPTQVAPLAGKAITP